MMLRFFICLQSSIINLGIIIIIKIVFQARLSSSCVVERLQQMRLLSAGFLLILLGIVVHQLFVDRHPSALALAHQCFSPCQIS